MLTYSVSDSTNGGGIGGGGLFADNDPREFAAKGDDAADGGLS